ncbi:MAG: hypothetical protein QW794_06480, partial [Thermosphaera sp.]
RPKLFACPARPLTRSTEPMDAPVRVLPRAGKAKYTAHDTSKKIAKLTAIVVSTSRRERVTAKVGAKSMRLSSARPAPSVYKGVTE